MGRLQTIVPLVISLGVIAVAPCSGFAFSSNRVQFGLVRKAASMTGRYARKAEMSTGVRRLRAADDAKSDQQMRDEALGFLEAQTTTQEDLAVQVRKAMWEAEVAADRARALREKRQGKSSVTKGNGLSSMLDPMAAAMLEEQGDYMRRCPVTEILESLEQTRCGVMQAFGAVQPATLLGLAMVLYAVSVLQLSQ